MIMQVLDFIPAYIDPSSPIIFVGISPSKNTSPMKNGTYARLQRWATDVGLKKFDFVNCIPDVASSSSMNDVNWDNLVLKCFSKKRVVALGNFPSKVLDRCRIPHLKIDHPSGLNRNLNSPDCETQMLKRLKEYIDEH